MDTTGSVIYFRILFSLLTFLTYYKYSCYYFTVRNKKYITHTLYMVLVVIQYVLIMINYPWLYILFPLIYVLFNHVCFKVSLSRNIAVTIFFLLIYFSSLLLVHIFFVLFLDSKQYMTVDFYPYLKQLVIYIINYISFTLIFNRKKYITRGNPYILLIYLVYGFNLIIIIISMYNYINYNNDETSMKNYTLLILFLNVFVLTLITFLYEKLITLHHERNEEARNTQLYQLNQTFYEEVSNKVDELRSIKHDFRNHLGIIKSSIEQAHYDKALDYLNSLYHYTEIADDILVTEHPIVSAILQLKKSECNQLGITLELDLRFPKIVIVSDIDLLVLISNILDNAIDSTKNSEDKLIIFTMVQVKSFLSITCVNSYSHKLIEKNGRFLSNKRGHEKPGIGTANIKNTCIKYKGEYHYTYTNSTFTTKIWLPNY